ncbi:MAG: hypothetical protein HYX84_01495 [Chloroflexi bacterium]|nr:hypothetical protein [Chloroflexota bacterium]
MVTSEKKSFQRLLTFFTVGVVFLVLLLSACQSGATTRDIEGVVQAVDGKEVVLTLPDGSRIRVEAEKQAENASNMIGEGVKAKIEVGDDNPKLIEMEKSSGIGVATSPEDFHFSGTIESMGADAWVVGGKSFKVNNATILDNGLAIGVLAEVEFITLADGTMLATKIETPASDDIAEDFSLTGVIGSISANEIVLGGKTFKIDANTMLDNGLAPGVVARVEFVMQGDGSLLALEVETDAPGAGVGEDFTAGGTIQSMDSVSVTVDGRKFVIDGTTILDSGLAPGVLVRVEFIVRPDGTLLAKEIETAGFDEGVNLYFAGPIESITPTAWVIGGKTFIVTAATLLDNGLAVGVNANVEFVIMPDGSFQAVHIEDSGFEFTGMVQAIAPDAYTIGGRIFKINANTLIDRGLKVRKLAQVNFLIQPDGSLLALKIKTAKTKVQGFSFKGVVQSMSATSIAVTGQTFQIEPTTVVGAGVAVGIEVDVVFDIKPGNVLSATSVQTAKTVLNR